MRYLRIAGYALGAFAALVVAAYGGMWLMGYILSEMMCALLYGGPC
jgi:hypothetical protein